VRFFSCRSMRWYSARCLLRFHMSRISVDFSVQAFNIAVCPCVCPWGYETIQRWTAKAIDPNRFFIASSRSPLSPQTSNHKPLTTICSCEETALLMQFVASLGVSQWAMHVDLHETTDSDLSEFRPAKASRDGVRCPQF